MNSLLHWIVLSTGLVLCARNSTAWAQPAADKAAADALFNEGKQLIAKGDDAAACPKFESSLAKAVQLGTQIALASCYEKIGKTASAWGAFRSAASAARKAHDKRQRFADDHASALESRLSTMRITIARGERIAGLEIKRDGTEVTPAELGSAVPFDPGSYLLEARAPGRQTWSTTVMVPASPGVVEVLVPTLEAAPERAERPERADGPERRGARPPRLLAGYAATGGGVAIIGASLIVGLVARSSWNDAQKACPDRLCEDKAGVDKARRAGTLGNIATGTFIAGSAVAAAGVILWLTAPAGAETSQPHTTALQLVPDVGPAQVGVSLQGGF
jgi:hypothetical protein